MNHHMLTAIVQRKAEQVVEQVSQVSVEMLQQMINGKRATRGFLEALMRTIDSGKPAVIAEIKKASPSRGVIREHFDVKEIATSYVANGASCLSVLTDRDFFQGCNDYLTAATKCVDTPILRKDFMIDEYQIYESRAIGADCILLIASILELSQIRDYYQLSKELGMDVIIEVHDQSELDMIEGLEPEMVGVNNRNLNDFSVSLQTSIDLKQQYDGFMISESGISSNQDVQWLVGHGINAFLVGESLMRQQDPGIALADMFAVRLNA